MSTSLSMALRLRFAALAAVYERKHGLSGEALAELTDVRGLLVELVSGAAPHGTDAQRAAIARNVLGPGPLGLRENLIRTVIGQARVRGPQLALAAKMRAARAQVEAEGKALETAFAARCAAGEGGVT